LIVDKAMAVPRRGQNGGMWAVVEGIIEEAVALNQAAAAEESGGTPA